MFCFTFCSQLPTKIVPKGIELAAKNIGLEGWRLVLTLLINVPSADAQHNLNPNFRQ